MLRHFRNRPAEIVFTNEVLENLNRVSLYTIGRNCSCEQAAVQYYEVIANPHAPTRIRISNSIWNTLATDQKIALLVHEYYLTDTIVMYGHCTVQETPRITWSSLSDQALKATPSDRRLFYHFECGGQPPINY